MRRLAIALFAVMVAVGITAPVQPASAAEPLSLVPFRFDPAHPDIIELKGEITPSSALAFRRTLLAAPDAKILLLDSPGGSVTAGLLIADDVHTRKLATVIPSGSTCASACSYIFLAGNERQADGRLGVHQMWSEQPDLQAAQMSIADVIDTLNRFGTPIGVVTIMFRTPPDDMYFFSAEEAAHYGINRKAGDPAPTMIPEPAVPTTTAAVSVAPGVLEGLPGASAASAVTPPDTALSVRSSTALSTLETYTRQPTRIAIYTGLDFFGEDVGSDSVADAPSCARRCLELGGACKAFTFNVVTKSGRGPNCFLKSGRGEVDGNSAAFSGELLARSDRDPAPMTLPVIDPVADLYRDVDIPGSDLSRRPNGAATEFTCRRACVTNDRCVAFTFLKPKKQCWLKGGVGTPRAMAGAVTGGKTSRTFSPDVVGLE